MDSFAIFTWTLTAITIGTYLNAKQNKYGFIIWGLCNLLWLCVDFTRGIYAQAALYVVLIGFNIYGWIQWKQKDKLVTQIVFSPYETKILRHIKNKIHSNLSSIDENFFFEFTRQELMALRKNLSNLP